MQITIAVEARNSNYFQIRVTSITSSILLCTLVKIETQNVEISKIFFLLSALYEPKIQVSMSTVSFPKIIFNNFRVDID